MKKLLELAPQVINLDEANDATMPILVEFESLFLFALEKTGRAPKSILNIVALVERILLQVSKFKKDVYVFYVCQDYGPSPTLSLIKRIVLLHLFHEQTASSLFKMVKLDERGCIGSKFKELIDILQPFLMMILDADRFYLPTCHIKYIEDLRTFALLYGLSVLDIADIEQNVGSVCILDKASKDRRNDLENACIYPLSKIWNIDSVSDVQLTDVDKQISILKDSGGISENILGVWRSHMELLQKLPLKERCIQIDGEWDELAKIIEDISAILLQNVDNWESGMIDLYDPFIFAFCCYESGQNGLPKFYPVTIGKESVEPDLVLPRNQLVEMLGDVGFDWKKCMDVYNYGKNIESNQPKNDDLLNEFNGLEHAHRFHWHNSKLIQDLSVKPDVAVDAPQLEQWQKDRSARNILRRKQQYSRFLERYSKGLDLGKFSRRESNKLVSLNAKEDAMKKKKAGGKKKGGGSKVDVRESVRLELLVTLSRLT
jgi:hypothetical protein